jgi:hypothetical protein
VITNWFLLLCWELLIDYSIYFLPRPSGLTGKWRRHHNEELYDLYSARNIIRVMKSRRMGRGRAYITCGERRGAYRVLVGKPEGGNHLEELGVDGRIILKSMFKKSVEGAWTGLIWLRIGTGGGRL